jgi:hypothetical protein
MSLALLVSQRVENISVGQPPDGELLAEEVIVPFSNAASADLDFIVFAGTAEGSSTCLG